MPRPGCRPGWRHSGTCCGLRIRDRRRAAARRRPRSDDSPNTRRTSPASPGRSGRNCNLEAARSRHCANLSSSVTSGSLRHPGCPRPARIRQRTARPGFDASRQRSVTQEQATAIAIDACERLGASLSATGSAAPPITSLRDLHALWIECGEAAYAAAAHREEFAAAQAELLMALVELRAGAQRT